ncbi:methyl-accepting chemotaxis protein [Pantoea agglomerans]|uniref:methyl-accepting chemotaxis protein n=1 Tax=Enterobacter agglomerans TaxID=549 RepID=UPI000F034BA2|nr:methyl-accepting chemotaxis protein [Pantoea agglomerans]AYP25759.1 chemotaxis protein [Pantoea agglomerans]
MKISTRLGFGFGTLIIFFSICIGVAIHSLYQAKNTLESVVQGDMKKNKLINELTLAQRDMAITVRNLSLFSDQALIQEQSERLAKLKTKFAVSRDQLSKLISQSGKTEEYKAFTKIRDSEKNALDAFSNTVPLALAKNSDVTVRYLLETVRPTQVPLLEGLTKMTEILTKQSDESVNQNAKNTERAYIILLTLLVIAIFFGISTSVYLIRKLMQELGDEPGAARNLAYAISNGDLTTSVRLKKNDTLSLMASLNSMQLRLRAIVSEIKTGSSSVALSANEISEGNNELASRTEQQAAALQQTAASMEQLTATVQNNSKTARETANSARDTASIAKKGESDVKRMSDTMSDISRSASKVRDITAVIESIAFQTNILALNAAVEAARAGETGRGFAVVASEVRTLAQRSATAAKDIKTLIEQAVGQVECGVTVANDTGQSILKVVCLVDELAKSMDAIAMSSAEQMQGISQVSIAVSQMDGVTQNNSALVEESSSASHSLSEQAQSLRLIVETFKV